MFQFQMFLSLTFCWGSQYFKMLILRKHTLPDHVTVSRTLTRKTITIQSRLKSELLQQYENEHLFKDPQTTSKSHNTSNENLHIRSHKKIKSFQFDDFDKILAQNRLTLDFSEPTKNTELPQISTFKKTQKLLISPPNFQQFKQASKVDGRFSSALSEAQREFNVKKMRIKIAKDSNIIVRHNFLLHAKSINQSISEIQLNTSLSKNRKNGFSVGYGPAERLRKNLKSLRKISYAWGLKQGNKIDKWKLKDFYDPILQQVQNDQINLNKLREREEILSKLKRINAQCSDIQSSTHVSQSIETFAKYSKKMSDKLVKKQRKIDKINFCSY